MAQRTVAIFTTTQGHKSIAEAIKAALANNYQVEVFYEVDDLFYSYYIFYKYAPFLFITPFVIGTDSRVLEIARRWMKRRYQKKITAFVNKVKPDLLINTFWMYEGSLETTAQTHNLPLINVISDPLTFHPTSLGRPPAINIMFDEAAETRLKKILPEAPTQVMGWFIRPTFKPATDKTDVRRQLNLPTEVPIILITSGSDGIENISELLSKLKTSTACQIIVACGTNASLQAKITALIPHLLKQSPNMKLTVLPFTKEIHLYMQAADLIVGKAGPNMIFESVATLTPFLATTHITGQEDGNLEIIRHYGLGWVEENPTSAAQLLLNLLEEPAKIAARQPALQKMASYNQQAPVKLLTLVDKLIQQ